MIAPCALEASSNVKDFWGRRHFRRRSRSLNNHDTLHTIAPRKRLVQGFSGSPGPGLPGVPGYPCIPIQGPVKGTVRGSTTEPDTLGRVLMHTVQEMNLASCQFYLCFYPIRWPRDSTFRHDWLKFAKIPLFVKKVICHKKAGFQNF